MSSPTLPGVVVAALAVLCAPGSGHGQSIVTDRPDFVESSATVGAGRLQVETSVAYERAGTSPGRAASFSIPTLVRVGLGSAVELRLESGLLVLDASSPALDGPTGLADASVGVKWHASDPAGWVPSSAVLLHVALPSGSSSLRGEGLRPSLRAVAEWDLPAGVGVGFMPGVALARDGGEGHAVGIAGLVLGKGVGTRARVFVELSFEAIAPERHGGHVGTWNAGASWLASDALQLDAAGSLAATAGAPDVRLSLGVSRRMSLRRGPARRGAAVRDAPTPF